ncbi:MAG TPA: response regulator, partial [Bacteroidia bacterium]|nr:response regulator [Bacteroidia bacterium]
MSEKKIVIIDDDTRNIFALGATLRAKGFQCQAFYDASEAIKELQKIPCDAVLIDMMMPDMDGYEAIPKIRQIPGREQIPI